MKIRIATRESPLALVQTHQVRDLLLQHYPALKVELVPMTTTADQLQHQSLAALGGKGLFIKKLEEALLANHADIAVHSLKDIPPSLEELFCLPAVLERHSPFDAFVSSYYESIEKLPLNAIVGTSSVRRKAALLHLRPDLKINMIRGNIGSRLKKLDEGKYDALILAEAGLARLGLTERIRCILSPKLFTPSVGQGVIAIECLKSRVEVIEKLTPLNHSETYQCITAERTMNQKLFASCTSPIGSFAHIHQGHLELKGVVWSQDGQHTLKTIQSGLADQAIMIGEQAAQDLKSQGAENYL